MEKASMSRQESAAKADKEFSNEAGVVAPILVIDEIVYKPASGKADVFILGFMSEEHKAASSPAIRQQVVVHIDASKEDSAVGFLQTIMDATKLAL